MEVDMGRSNCIQAKSNFQRLEQACSRSQCRQQMIDEQAQLWLQRKLKQVDTDVVTIFILNLFIHCIVSSRVFEFDPITSPIPILLIYTDGDPIDLKNVVLARNISCKKVKMWRAILYQLAIPEILQNIEHSPAARGGNFEAN